MKGEKRRSNVEGLEVAEVCIRRFQQLRENDTALLSLQFSGLPFPHDQANIREKLSCL